MPIKGNGCCSFPSPQMLPKGSGTVKRSGFVQKRENFSNGRTRTSLCASVLGERQLSLHIFTREVSVQYSTLAPKPPVETRRL